MRGGRRVDAITLFPVRHWNSCNEKQVGNIVLYPRFNVEVISLPAFEKNLPDR